jgi:hypothetical protein
VINTNVRLSATVPHALYNKRHGTEAGEQETLLEVGFPVPCCEGGALVSWHWMSTQALLAGQPKRKRDWYYTN